MKKVTILGFGNIGREFFKKTKKKRIVKNILVRKIKKYDIFFIKKIINKNIYITKFYKNLKIAKIIIETIGGKKIYKILKKIIKIRKIKKIITANKNLISKKYKNIIKLSKKKNIKFCFEASVGGGIPLVKSLMYINCVNFYEIFTIINGTTNYILTCISDGLKKKKAFIIARKKGFAEKNINFDIRGIDIAYKLNIIISILYNCYIKIKNINIEKLSIPKEKIFFLLKKKKYLIKYVGRIIKKKNIIDVSIFPIIINKNSIYNVKYEYNFILLKSKKFGNLFIKSKGAGKYPTSISIVSDLNSNLKNKFKNFKLFYSNRIIKEKIFIFTNKKRMFNFYYKNVFKNFSIKEFKGNIHIVTKEFLDSKRIFFFNKYFLKEIILRIR
ncbi:hypothetical protein ONB66_00515 [Candidatus Vidania fulgoroideae]|nr:hypothetical protein ONB66_00515 [Candidatus Vidania fulgoroideae]